jgi:hypothetical protein
MFWPDHSRGKAVSEALNHLPVPDNITDIEDMLTMGGNSPATTKKVHAKHIIMMLLQPLYCPGLIL